MELERIMLLVTRFDEMFRFYRDVIGLEVTYGTEGDSFASFKPAGGAKLSIFKRSSMAAAVDMEPIPSESRPQDRFVLLIESDDLEESLARFKGLGVAPVTPVQRHPEWGIRAFHFRDPEGNLIQVMQGLPREEWTGELREESGRYPPSG